MFLSPAEEAAPPKLIKPSSCELLAPGQHSREDGPIIIKEHKSINKSSSSVRSSKTRRLQANNNEDYAEAREGSSAAAARSIRDDGAPFRASCTQLGTDHRRQQASCSSGGGGGNSISEFSAFTLGKAFKLSKLTNDPTQKLPHQQPQHQQQRQKGLSTMLLSRSKRKSSQTNLSSVAAAVATTISVGTASIPAVVSSEGHLRGTSLCSSSSVLSSSSSASTDGLFEPTRCKCCCCSYKCAASVEARQQQQQQISANKSSRLQQGCRPTVREMRLGPTANQLSGRSNVTSGRATRAGWQKTTTRKPIPVPPPIVPLHRQLACGLQDSASVCDRGGSFYENPPSSSNICGASHTGSLTFRLHGPTDRGAFCGPSATTESQQLNAANIYVDRRNPSCNDLIWRAPDKGSSLTLLLDNKARTIGVGGNGLANGAEASQSTATMTTAVIGPDYEENWTELSHKNHDDSTQFAGCVRSPPRLSSPFSSVQSLPTKNPGSAVPSSVRPTVLPPPNPSSSEARHRLGARDKRDSDGDNLDPLRSAKCRPSGCRYSSGSMVEDGVLLTSQGPIQTSALLSGMMTALSDIRISSRGGDPMRPRINNTPPAICVGKQHQDGGARNDAADNRLDFSSHRQMPVAHGMESQSPGRANVTNRSSSADTPIVDIRFTNHHCDGFILPQANMTTMTASTGKTPSDAESEQNRHQHKHDRSSLSAIYDLPESGGAREYVRVEVTDGKRTVTVHRLPLRPARRPSMPPPPPPSSQRRPTATAGVIPAPADGGSTDSGCVVANFSDWREPVSTLNVSALSEQATIDERSQPEKKLTRPQQQQQQISPQIKLNNRVELRPNNSTHDKSDNRVPTSRPVADLQLERTNANSSEISNSEQESTLKVQRNQLLQLARKIVRFNTNELVGDLSRCRREAEAAAAADAGRNKAGERQQLEPPNQKLAKDRPSHSGHSDGGQRILLLSSEQQGLNNQRDKPNETFSAKGGPHQLRKSGHKRDSSPEQAKEGRQQQQQQLVNQEGGELEGGNNRGNKNNMGSSHSNSATKAAIDTRQQSSLTSSSKLDKGAGAAAKLVKARSHEESKQKKDSYNADSSTNDSSNRQSTSDLKSTTSGTPSKMVATLTDESVPAPQIIKSISNMTNKLVCEAKMITGVLHHHHHHHQHQQYGGSDSESSNEKPHMPSALQMCIKGVVKSPTQKNAQQTPAGNKRALHHHAPHLLERPPSNGTADSMERRRKSLQDGDVFIYPRLYKDLNECRKCLRDNRICNCIEMELSSDGSSSTGKIAAPQAPNDPIGSFEARLPHEKVSPSHNLIPIDEHNIRTSIDHKSSGCYDNDGARKPAGDYDHYDQRKPPVYTIRITAASNEQAPEELDMPQPSQVAPSASLNIGIPAAAGHETTEDVNNNIFIIETSLRSTQNSNQPSGSKCVKKSNANSESGSKSESSTLERDAVEGAATSARADTSPSQLGDSELVISRRADFGGASGTGTSTKLLEQRTSSWGPLENSAVSSVSEACIVTNCDRRPSNPYDSSPPNSQRDDSSVEAARQESLMSRIEVRRSSSSISLLSQKSSSPLKVETKVTTISIGGNPTASWKEPATICPTNRDANNNYMVSIRTNGDRQNSEDTTSRNSSSDVAIKEPHTSVISIQNRRRKLEATKNMGGRRAIYEDDQDIDGLENHDPLSIEANDPSSRPTCQVSLGNNTRGVAPSMPAGSEGQLLLLEPITPICEPLTSTCSSGSFSGTGLLDYSPILSSVRDYIKNMNTELQVQTSMDSPLRVDNSLIAISSGSGSNLDSSVIRNAMRAADLVVASPSTIPRSLASSSCSSFALESPIQVVTSSANGIVQATFTTALPAASIKAHVQAAPICVNSDAESTDSSLKKSIFDGASKDEILEYLEDARERVPEILMAADDVMVINENELIVVNQLEPDSPATPISIVETNKVNSAVDADCSQTEATKSLSQHHSLTHPDQLRQHLEQMYQTSQLVAASAQANQNSPEPASQTNRADSHELIFNQEKANNQTLEEQAPPAGGPEESRSTTTKSHCGPLMDLLNFAGPIYVGRRNSVSESMSQPAGRRENAMQILALQKLYTADGNSLSSPSSSPPSSTTPSSSSSSNHTSGNCSAATSFYASSSLSCSSPLLNLHGTLTNPSSSPAFNQTVPPQINESLAGCHALSSCFTPAGLDRKFDQSDLRSLQEDNSTSSNRATPVTTADSTSRELFLVSPDVANQVSAGTLGTDLFLSQPNHVERDDSGIGSEPIGASNRLRSMTISSGEQPAAQRGSSTNNDKQLVMNGKLGYATRSNSETGHLNSSSRCDASALISAAKLSRIDESAMAVASMKPQVVSVPVVSHKYSSISTKTSTISSSSNARFSTQIPNKQQNSGIGIHTGSRGVHAHYNTLNRLNNYFMNRHPFSSSSESTVEFQCLDCDQFIDVDQATIMNKTNELRLLRATDSQGRLDCSQGGGFGGRDMTPEQLDRAYVAAMNGLPLCKTCEKKRIERKEIISEFVETELKYGRDLKIIHDEFYRPMQVAGLLSKDQINGVFLNLEELIMAHCKFADRLESAIREAHSIGDTDFNTVNIGGLFVESAEMLHTFESYCIRQGAAACLLARLAKERELLRIFLRVSQMENTLLRRMNLAAFLMVPVQRVTKYPLLLNRLYKVTAYHHKDREVLRDAQLKVELHLEHINQQTKGIGASNKIWRRISSLSAPISNRRGLMNAEDIGYIKLRKTAMDMLKWDRDETQFIHSGKIHFAPLTEYLTRQKMKPLRYIPAHALLIVLGRPNWKYRPDLVKANLDSKLMFPTQGGTGIKEAALLLFREKNGRFVPCREPLLLSNCVLSADCSQYNNECPQNQPNILRQSNQISSNQQHQQSHNGSSGSRKASSSCSSNGDTVDCSLIHKSEGGSLTGSIDSTTTNRSMSPKDHHHPASNDSRTSSLGGDVALISSLRGLIEDGGAQSSITSSGSSPPGVAAHSSRSYSLASALPRTALATTNSSVNLSKPIMSTASSNLTILNQLMTKVNSYHNRQSTNSNQGKQTAAISSTDQSTAKNRPVSPSASLDNSVSSHLIPTTTPTPATSSEQLAAEQAQQLGNSQRLITSGIGGGSCNGTTINSGRANNATSAADGSSQPSYNNYHNFHYNHHQPYGDYEESFEMHERAGKESMLLRADTPLRTRYWLQILRYHAKDLGSWRSRRNGLPNIMMMRHE